MLYDRGLTRLKSLNPNVQRSEHNEELKVIKSLTQRNYLVSSYYQK